MQINNIKLKSFRNYTNLELNLSPNINIFYGDNASGKTSLLEAIYLCSLGKSFRTRKDKELINFQSNIAIAQISYEKKDRYGNIKIIIENKKNIELNGIKNKRISELIRKCKYCNVFSR